MEFVVLDWAQCLLVSVVKEGGGFDSSILRVVVSEMWSEDLSFSLGAEVPDFSEVLVPLDDLVSWELGSNDKSFSIFDWELELVDQILIELNDVPGVGKMLSETAVDVSDWGGSLVIIINTVLGGQASTSLVSEVHGLSLVPLHSLVSMVHEISESEMFIHSSTVFLSNNVSSLLECSDSSSSGIEGPESITVLKVSLSHEEPVLLLHFIVSCSFPHKVHLVTLHA